MVTDVIVRSEESAHIFGLIGEPIKLTKHDLLARVHTEDRQRFMNSLVECTPEIPNTQISYRLLRPDGSLFWLERTGHAFFDHQGKMVRMIGMVADITERGLCLLTDQPIDKSAVLHCEISDGSHVGIPFLPY